MEIKRVAKVGETIKIVACICQDGEYKVGDLFTVKEVAYPDIADVHAVFVENPDTLIMIYDAEYVVVINFNICDIIPEMLVEIRTGERFIIVNIEYNGLHMKSIDLKFISLSGYNADMTHSDYINFDIVKVYGINCVGGSAYDEIFTNIEKRELLYEREN